MARPPSTAGGRPHSVTVRFSDDELAALDVARRGVSRVTYLRGLVPGLGHIKTDPFIPPYVEEAVQVVSPNVPAPAVEAGKVVVPAPPERHLHRYSQKEHVGYIQGKKTHRWECICGAEKVQ